MSTSDPLCGNCLNKHPIGHPCSDSNVIRRAFQINDARIWEAIQRGESAGMSVDDKGKAEMIWKAPSVAGEAEKNRAMNANDEETRCPLCDSNTYLFQGASVTYTACTAHCGMPTLEVELFKRLASVPRAHVPFRKSLELVHAYAGEVMSTGRTMGGPAASALVEALSGRKP